MAGAVVLYGAANDRDYAAGMDEVERQLRSAGAKARRTRAAADQAYDELLELVRKAHKQEGGPSVRRIAELVEISPGRIGDVIAGRPTTGR